MCVNQIFTKISVIISSQQQWDGNKLHVAILESGAGVAQSVQCLTTDWTTGVRSSTEERDFSSSPCVQEGSGAHPASYPMGTGGPFPG
jgi:hypothetical protein